MEQRRSQKVMRGETLQGATRASSSRSLTSQCFSSEVLHYKMTKRRKPQLVWSQSVSGVSVWLSQLVTDPGSAVLGFLYTSLRSEMICLDLAQYKKSLNRTEI